MHELIAILGPTASGKSDVALALAHRLGGEIVSCDSMQVYRGMDIGTAKPSAAERASVPHHLIDLLDIDRRWDVASFREEADRAIRDILARGRRPILCGGTGYYAKVLLYGLPLPPGDARLAAEIEAECAARGEAALLAELTRLDPVSAARVGGNRRRLLRAVQIVRLLGGPVPDPVTEATPPPYAGPQFVLAPPPSILRERIARRTRAMLAAGWIDEVERLVGHGLLATPTASQALGYPQIAAWLAAGRGDRDALTEELIVRTRQYAKRQRTWFRHQHPGAVMLETGHQRMPESLADAIVARLGG